MPDRVVLDQAELARLLESPAGPLGEEILRRAIRVESGAKRLAPVDTGRLRSSITHELSIDMRGLVARVGTDVEYAPYVEFGTARMSAQPYLVPALRQAT